MTNAKSAKRALLCSVMAMIICVSMLIGTTFAWFTDSASTAVNKIQSGTLDVQLLDENGNSLEGQTLTWKTFDNREQSEILWEPGCTYELQSFKIKNNGNLALKYKIIISGIVGDNELLNAIDFAVSGVTEAETATALNGFEGQLIPNSETALITITGKMKNEAGNEYQGLSIDGIGITVVATQYTYENDSIDNQYDDAAEFDPADAIYINGVRQAASTTIQNAIDAAQDGDVISLGTATYTEALKIDNKNITIQGSAGTVITFDANTVVPNVAAIAGETTGYNGIITAYNATVTLNNITIKGNIDDAYPKMYNYRYGGVMALNSDVTMNNCVVEDIIPTEQYVGVQNGFGIYAVSDTAKTLNLNNTVIKNFQKTGILTRANVTLNINGGSITGLGKTSLTAQNGIQYSGPATIKNMTISGIYYTGNAGAIALFAYPINNVNSVIDNVTVNNCQYDITVYSAGTVAVSNSNLTKIHSIASDATLTFDGVEQQAD